MNNEDIQSQVRGHQRIFISLGVLTVVSAGIALLLDGGSVGIAIAMGIAFIQGVLILRELMHLKESSSMRGLIGLTIFFAAYLLFASWLAYTNEIEGTDILHYSVEEVGSDSGHLVDFE